MEVTSGKIMIKSFGKAVLTSAALTMNYGLIADDISTSGYANPQTPFASLSKLLYGIEMPTVTFLLLIGFLTLFYAYIDNRKALSKRTMTEVPAVWGIRIAAFFAAVCTMIGKLFYVYDDIWMLGRGTIQLLKGLLVLCGLFWLFLGLIWLAVSEYMRYCEKSTDRDLGKELDKKKVGIVIAAFIFAAWLPTVMAYYPAVFMGDSENIIYMAYNYPSGLENTVLPLKEGIYVTDHHPVIYTLYVSMILHAVRALGGSWNTGIFFCAIIQCLLTVCILAYSCIYCAKQFQNGKLALAAALFYALCPWIPKYAMMISKDTFFADLLLLWVMIFYRAVNTDNKKRDTVALIAVSTGVALIRKNGIYIIILTLFFAIILYKNLWKRWILVILCILAVSTLYSNVILPCIGIPKGGIQEMLSIPFQQTARYVKYHGDEVTDAQKHAIADVLDYDTLAQNYTGNLSDAVKGTYNKNATRAQQRAYLAVWFQMFFKHPEEYVAAFLNNYYGYFYPVVNDGMKIARTSVGSMANTNRDGYFDFSHSYNSFHTGLRDILTFYDLLWMRIPVLNLLMTSALYVWVVLAVLFLKCIRRDKAGVLASIMYVALILTVLAGPSNAINYERYVFPCILGMPFLICTCFCGNPIGKKGEGKDA